MAGAKERMRMMDMELCRTEAIARNIGAVKDKIARSAERAGRSAGEITLLAATKTRGYGEIRAAIAAGIGAAGENRVQELRDKCALGAYDGCPLHFIGPLQTNKIKYLIGNAAMIHSVDSARLAEAISALSARAGVVTDVLIEVNIGGEASKSGVAPRETAALAQQVAGVEAVRLRGLMTVPPAGEDARGYFAAMRALFESLRGGLPEAFNVLSMGMSHDFETAVEEGATIVRVGSAIFGPRPAPHMIGKEQQL